LKGREVILRFILRNAELYAFRAGRSEKSSR